MLKSGGRHHKVQDEFKAVGDMLENMLVFAVDWVNDEDISRDL